MSKLFFFSLKGWEDIAQQVEFFSLKGWDKIAQGNALGLMSV